MTGVGVTIHMVDILRAPVIAALHDATRRPFDESWNVHSVAEVLAMPGTAAWVSNVDGNPLPALSSCAALPTNARF